MNAKKNADRLVLLGEGVTDVWLEEKMTDCVRRLKKNMQRYGTHFPSACGTNGMYRIKDNDDWTNGFWTGMLWLAYEWTHEETFKTAAMKNITSFQDRLDAHFILDHHDIGFLYSLSAGAGYKITGNDRCKQEVLQAAKVLAARYQEKGQFLQAWGKLDDPKEYRLIIDSLLNLPLLFGATKISGDPHYAAIATNHYHTLMQTVIKPDGTTYHTYYFDPATGQPSHGATHQGNSDQSIWARGQSWAVLGIPLDESFVHSTPFPPIYPHIVDVFLAHLPADLVPYWDFDFDDQHPSDKDSSALAIAACGLLEAAKVDAYPRAQQIAKGMVYQLGTENAASQDPESEGLLLHGVYAHAEGKGIDEPNLWGDYFYLEALMRLAKPNWQRYW